MTAGVLGEEKLQSEVYWIKWWLEGFLIWQKKNLESLANSKQCEPDELSAWTYDLLNLNTEKTSDSSERRFIACADIRMWVSVCHQKLWRPEN